MKLNKKISLTLNKKSVNKTLGDIKDDVNIKLSNEIILGISIKWMVFLCATILWYFTDKSILFSQLIDKFPASFLNISFVAFLFLVTLCTKNTDGKRINDVIDSSLPNIHDNLREDVFISLLNEKNLKEIKKHKKLNN